MSGAEFVFPFQPCKKGERKRECLQNKTRKEEVVEDDRARKKEKER